MHAGWTLISKFPSKFIGHSLNLGIKYQTGNGHKLENAPRLWLDCSPPTSAIIWSRKTSLHARFYIVNSAPAQSGRVYNDLIRDYLFIGIGHYVQTLEPYWAPPFWIIKRSRENTGLPIWIIMRTHDLIYILIYVLIYILMKWLLIDFPNCNIKMCFFFKDGMGFEPGIFWSWSNWTNH